jgi:hypothetical protein
MFEVHLHGFAEGDITVECETMAEALRATADAMEKQRWKTGGHIDIGTAVGEHEVSRPITGLFWTYDGGTWESAY